MVKVMRLLFYVIIQFTICKSGFAQEKISGVTPCIDSLIKAVKPNNHYLAYNVHFSNETLTLKSQSESIEFKDEKKIDWFRKIEVDSAIAYKLTDSSGNSCFLLRSSYLNATGLGSNFTTWLILFNNSTNSISFESLSQNPGLIYFDPKTNKLKFIRITYGDHFFWNRDWNKIDYKLETNEINNGSNQVISSKISWCR